MHLQPPFNPFNRLLIYLPQIAQNTLFGEITTDETDEADSVAA